MTCDDVRIFLILVVPIQKRYMRKLRLASEKTGSNNFSF